jgi:hypothetical protein
MLKIFEAFGAGQLEKLVNDCKEVKSVISVYPSGVGVAAACEMSDKYVAPVSGKKPDRAALKAARSPAKKPTPSAPAPSSSSEEKPGRGQRAAEGGK